jgi:hypothetical protein
MGGNPKTKNKKRTWKAPQISNMDRTNIAYEGYESGT